MYCPKCGAYTPDDATAAFCMSCGSPMPKMSDQTMRPAQEQDILNLLNRAQQGTSQPESILPVEPSAAPVVAPVAHSAQGTQEVTLGQGAFQAQPAQPGVYEASPTNAAPEGQPVADAFTTQVVPPEMFTESRPDNNLFEGRPLEDMPETQTTQPVVFADSSSEAPAGGTVEAQATQPVPYISQQENSLFEDQPPAGAAGPQATQPVLFEEAQPGGLFEEQAVVGAAQVQAAQPGLFAEDQQGGLFDGQAPGQLDGQPGEDLFAQGAGAQEPQLFEQPTQGAQQPVQAAPVYHAEQQKGHAEARQQDGAQAQARPQHAAAPTQQQPQAAKTAEITAARPTAAQIQERLMAQQTVAMPVSSVENGAAGSPPRPPVPAAQAQRQAKQPLPPKPPKPPKPIPPYEEEPEEPKRGGAKTLLTILGFFVIFVVLLAGITIGMLMFMNRPGATISKFVDAVSAGDTATIESMIEDNKLVVQGVQPDSEGWAALFSAFDSSSATTALTGQLNQLADGGEVDADQLAYAAIGIEGQELFWFIDHYHITITAVNLTVPAADGTTTLWLDDQSFGGTPAASGTGMVYSGLMPGRYSMRLESTGGAGLTTQAEDIDLFNNITYEPAQVGYTVTISGCVSDVAILYVNKQAVDVTPVNGVVTIPNVVLGALIEIEAELNGMIYRSNVSFTESDVTYLEFVNYTQEIPGDDSSSDSSSSSDASAPVQPTTAEVDALLVEFYTSYLECINQQSMAPIKGTTTSYNTELSARIVSDNNKPYEFQYVSTACDPASLGTFDDGARIRVNASFSYNYRDRDTLNEYTAGNNYQTVELVWQNGQWLVNGMSFVNENDFNNHVRVD